MAGVLDTIAAATPLRHTVHLVLDSALNAEWERLKSSLDAAAAHDSKHASTEEPHAEVDAVVAAMDALRDRMAASRVGFTFERIPWTEHLALQSAHPPRKGNLIDRIRGYNTDSFTPILIRRGVVAVTDATGDTATEIPESHWTSLLGTVPVVDEEGTVTVASPGVLNLQQVNELADAATLVNDGMSQVPPSARSSLSSQDSGASFEQPSPGTSAPDGSTAGNPPGSPTTSTSVTDTPSPGNSPEA